MSPWRSNDGILGLWGVGNHDEAGSWDNGFMATGAFLAFSRAPLLYITISLPLIYPHVSGH
jgi:hypothetical protein